jgi:hypothetical protein
MIKIVSNFKMQKGECGSDLRGGLSKNKFAKFIIEWDDHYGHPIQSDMFYSKIIFPKGLMVGGNGGTGGYTGLIEQ